MDKNSIIGFLLIIAVIFGFSYFNRPDEERLKQQREEQQRRVMDELDNINTMDKSGLVEYAYANYEQKLSMKQTLPDLRKSVIELVHQFGVVGI